MVRRLIPFIITIVAAPLAAQAQPSGAIIGRVLSATAAPIVEATVTIEGLARSARTGLDGNFRIDSLAPGIYTVRAAAIGFAPAVRTDVAVSSGRPTEVSLLLRERPVELAELEVIAEPYFPPATGAPPGSASLGAEEVRRAPGVQEDVVRAVALLPGVGVTTNARNDLVVRGGAPFENLFVVDHLEVPNINHFGSQGSTGGPVGLVNVALVDQVDFSAGGFGARYGDRVGSSTEITLREGNRQRLAGQGNFSATGFGGFIEGPLGSQGTFLASVRRSYLDLLFDLIGFRFLPSYWDAELKLTRRLGARDELSWTTVGALDRIDFNNRNSKDRVDNSRILRLNQDQYFSGLTWRHATEHALVHLTAGRVFTRFNSLQFDSLTPPAPLFRNRSSEGENSLGVEYLRETASRTSWSAGASGRYASRLRYDIDLPGALRTDHNGAAAPLRVDTSFTAFRAGGWAEATTRWTLAFQTTLGGRLDYYGDLRGAWRGAPRLSASLTTGRSVWTLAFGRYWQAPSRIWLVGDPTNVRRLAPLRADHLVLGLARLLRPDLRLQVQAYAKRYRDYPARVFRPEAVLSPTGFEDVKSDIPFGLEPLVSDGRGRAYGLELFLQKKLSAVPLYGLASVSVGRSRFTGLDGVDRPSAFDGRLIANLLVGWRPGPAWELSGKFRVASGLPSTPFVTSGAFAGQLDFSRYNAGPRLPTFHALDLRLDRRWSWRGVQLATYLDVQNVYGRNNVSEYTWDERTQRVKADEAVGVLPSLGVTVEF